MLVFLVLATQAGRQGAVQQMSVCFSLTSLCFFLYHLFLFHQCVKILDSASLIILISSPSQFHSLVTWSRPPSSLKCILGQPSNEYHPPPSISHIGAKWKQALLHSRWKHCNTPLCPALTTGKNKSKLLSRHTRPFESGLSVFSNLTSYLPSPGKLRFDQSRLLNPRILRVLSLIVSYGMIFFFSWAWTISSCHLGLSKFYSSFLILWKCFQHPQILFYIFPV